MKKSLLLSLLAFSAHAEEKQLFNGKDLTGWEGDTRFWTVQDGTIVGKTTPDNPAPQNTFLIWKDGEPENFDLTLQYKMTPGDEQNYTNSGIQYRSQVVDPERFIVSGYQADFEYGSQYSGILYEERGRGILAHRGQKVTIANEKDSENPDQPSIEVTGETGNSDEIQAGIDKDGWNTYRIVANGNHLQHYINGKLTIDVTDNSDKAAKTGVIALQLHSGPPMQVQFKDIVLITK